METYSYLRSPVPSFLTGIAAHPFRDRLQHHRYGFLIHRTNLNHHGLGDFVRLCRWQQLIKFKGIFKPVSMLKLAYSANPTRGSPDMDVPFSKPQMVGR